MKRKVPGYIFAAAKAGQTMQARTGFERAMTRLPRSLEEMRALPALKEVSPGAPKPSAVQPPAAERSDVNLPRHRGRG